MKMPREYWLRTGWLELKGNCYKALITIVNENGIVYAEKFSKYDELDTEYINPCNPPFCNSVKNFPEINNCPFCGGVAEARFRYNSDGDGVGVRIYWVECKNCNNRTRDCWEELKAITVWNKRN